MGFYIQTPENHGKAKYICENLGGRVIPFAPRSKDDVPTGLVPVCVVNNGYFEAAGVAFSQGEVEAFAGEDGRLKMWLLVPREEVIKAVPSVKQHLQF